MLKFKANKEKHREQVSKYYEEEQFSFRPKTYGRPFKINSTRSLLGLPCHERLYQLYRGCGGHNSLVSNLYNNFPQDNREFIPEIGTRARELVRKKPISVALYEDALERHKKHYPAPSFSQTKTSMKSLELLINRFLKEYKALSEKHDAHNTGRVNYSGFLSMFDSIMFVSHPAEKPSAQVSLRLQLWKLLSNTKDYVKLDDLKVGMLGIMGYYQPWMADSSSQDFTLNETETKKFHQKYRELYNKLWPLHEQEKESESTVKTALNRTREYDTKVEDRLLLLGLDRDRQLKALQSRSELRAMDECTFQPYIREYRSKGKYEAKGFSGMYRQTSSSQENIFERLYGFSQFVKDRKSELSQQPLEHEEKVSEPEEILDLSKEKCPPKSESDLEQINETNSESNIFNFDVGIGDTKKILQMNIKESPDKSNLRRSSTLVINRNS